MDLLGCFSKRSSKRENNSKNKKRKCPRQDDITKYLIGKENKPETKNVDSDISRDRTIYTQINLKNLLFYQNKLKSRPNGDYIEDILIKWYGNYDKLEKHHGYIQWLFPLKERGRNGYAEPLKSEEIREITSSLEMKGRLLRAYKMMLDFYGFDVINDTTGEVKPSALHDQRIAHLKKSRHNYLRITRILRSLSLLRMENITYSFLTELIYLSFVKDAPLSNCRQSCVNFWIPALSDKNEICKYEALTRTLEKN